MPAISDVIKVSRDGQYVLSTGETVEHRLHVRGGLIGEIYKI